MSAAEKYQETLPAPKKGTLEYFVHIMKRTRSVLQRKSFLPHKFPAFVLAKKNTLDLSV